MAHEAQNGSTASHLLPGVPDVESPLFERIFAGKNVAPETVEIARTLRRDGYVVIDFPDPDFGQIADKIVRTLDGQYDWNGWRNGTVPNLRIQDAWNKVPEVKRLATNPAVLKLLSDLYGRRAFPFQTLNFSVGTQQHYHSDSIHFSSCPERFMAGVWVALEDIDSDNGPLIYYPGSHALPIFTNEHVGVNPDTQGPSPTTHYPQYEQTWEALVESLDLKPLEFHAKKGQALIWAANLLHGGAAQRDRNRTRYSQVTHYYFENCSYYTPLVSVPLLGPVLYRELVDISTGKPVPNKINDFPVPKKHIEHTKPTQHAVRAVQVPPDFDPKAYLRANPDVAKAKVDPLQHYITFGRREGRPIR